MDARIVRAVLLTAVLASFGAGYRTPNFSVDATSEGLAQRVGLAAEKYRRELAVLWLGKELPDWADPCPIKVQVAPHLGAGGETSFVFDRGEVFGWKMRVQGSEERVLDSVLPHEITHTILATHFRRPLPRWADEGACTTVEHASERNKQQNLLITFLRTNKGIAFSQMFAMKEYPPDMLPLYAQGYSLARYLIEQGGRKKFLEYVSEGLKRENWSGATKSYYGYTNLAHLQNSWLDWVKQGSPTVDKPAGQPNHLVATRENRAEGRNSKNDAVSVAQARFQSDDRTRATNAGVSDDRVSTFDPQEDWNARDGRRRSDDSPLQLARRDLDDSRAVQSNKRSVYDRGIEPSGNAHQYPFKASSRQPADERQAFADTGTSASERVAGGPTNRRRVILEWSRNGSHERRDGDSLVDASW